MLLLIMAKWNVREKNGMWKGGRTITQHGYVLIRVGLEHPLSDCRGYAYEHRLVACKKLGRALKKGEIVHHINGNRQDNRPENIEICKSVAWHRKKHRKNGKLRNPEEKNRKIFCACGCYGSFLKYDKQNRPRKYISGHNGRKHGK